MVIDAVENRELGQLRIGDLRAACQKRGLPTCGRKDQLRARIVAADKAHAKKQKTSNGRQANPTPSSNRPTALCGQSAVGPPGGIVSKEAVMQRSGTRSMIPSSPQMLVTAGKNAFVSPLRDSCLDSVQEPTCFTRRRLRVKSPAPHSLANSDLSPGSPLRHHALLSPERRAPRRRLREKSPCPQRYDRDDLPRDFRPARQANSPLALRKVSSSSFEMSPEPCRMERLSRSTPGIRLQHTTSLMRTIPHPPESSTASAGKDDPSAALMLLPERELREMCVECVAHLPVREMRLGGTKMALVQRIIEAHAASAAPQRERTDHVVPTRLKSDLCSAEGAICNVANAIPCSPSVRPSRRLSGGVPLPPLSWVSPQLVDDVNGAQATSSPEQAALKQMPKSLLLTSRSSSIEVQQATNATTQVAATPLNKEASLPRSSLDMPVANGSPVNRQASESAGSSTDWWHQVKSRWPQIVANLRTTPSGKVHGAVASSPSVPRHSETRKRQLGSPSIFDDFQSPKRHCLTPLD